ncbi:unnamed protein product [Strongylus vulgaris]|uniref:C-type lectin domain-containing protein n=1 Tax=Strongylus vulgaris TaxID=40348 RepID=A0A3P7IM90_STRVU|nr:unnamed protein product [Strongylus vulgaris]
MPPWESKFWIGLHRKHGPTFVWTDGNEFFDNPGHFAKPSNFTMWCSGYPIARGDCVYMQQHNGTELCWFNADCDNDENYICERKPCDTDNYCSFDDK